MFSSGTSSFWGTGTMRETEADPVEVSLDDWIMTCGGTTEDVSAACGDVLMANDCSSSSSRNRNNSNSNSNNRKKNNHLASSHRGRRAYDDRSSRNENSEVDIEQNNHNFNNGNSSDGNNINMRSFADGVDNDVATALQAYAESRRRSARFEEMDNSNNNSSNNNCGGGKNSFRASSLDMAARLHHSFTKNNRLRSNGSGRAKLGPEDEYQAPGGNSSITVNNDVVSNKSLRMKDLINRHQHYRNTTHRQSHDQTNKQNGTLRNIDAAGAVSAVTVAPRKADDKDSIQTDSDSSSSAGDEKYGDDENENGDDNNNNNNVWSRRCLWICLLLTVILVGVGAGVGISMKNSSNATNSSSDNLSGSTNSSPDNSNSNSNSNSGSATIGADDWASAITAVPGALDGWNGSDSNNGSTDSPSSQNGNSNNDGEGVVYDGYDYRANSKYLVGAYYYPWHGDGNFHNNEGYIRSELIPPHQPELGEYNDSDPRVIAAHMRYFRQANIGLLVTSWWGPRRMEDTTTRNVIMDHEDVGNLQIALHYETSGRIKSEDMSTVREDMRYICETYFDHPNYYKIDGRPVLVIYVSRALSNEGRLEEALLTMRSEVSKCGHNLYLIGDQVFAKAPDTTNEPFIPFWYFDAVTNYDVYGSANKPTPYALKERVDDFYNEQQKWRELALEENCRFIPPVAPGYNDRGVRIERDHPPLSRRLDVNSEEGSLFWYQLKKALPLVDPGADNMILVNSFNEWHEDTQIEPVIGDPASEPFNLTSGLTYVGYGDLYLDILRAATTEGQEDVFDFLLA